MRNRITSNSIPKGEWIVEKDLLANLQFSEPLFAKTKIQPNAQDSPPNAKNG